MRRLRRIGNILPQFCQTKRKILENRFDYNSSEGCSVEEFDPQRLALPSRGGVPVVLKDVLDPAERRALCKLDQKLMDLPEVVEGTFSGGCLQT